MEFPASFLDKIFARQPPAHGCINALWQTRRSHSTQPTIAQAFARRNALCNCSQCAVAPLRRTHRQAGHMQRFRHGPCALEPVPFFRGRMRWQEPIPAKAPYRQKPHTDKGPVPAKGGRRKCRVSENTGPAPQGAKALPNDRGRRLQRRPLRISGRFRPVMA